MLNKNTPQRGFTLIELLIVVSIGVTVTLLAAPSFSSMIRNNRLVTQANDFVSILHHAKSEAVRRGAVVTVCKSSSGTACGGNWEDGWISFVDGGTVGTVDTGEERLRVHEGMNDSATTFRGDTNAADQITFDARGFSRTFNGQLALCQDGSGGFNDTNTRVVVVNNTGRAKALAPSALAAEPMITPISSCTP